MKRLVRKLLLVLTTAAAAITTSSCNGGVEPIPETGATLEGKVTYGGQPVPMAFVIVAQAGQGGTSSTATADDEGNYKAVNVPVGEVLIAVNTDATKGMMAGRGMAGSDPKKKGKSGGGAPKLIEVPKKYHKPDTSGFKTTTSKGANTYNVEIPK